jgi:chaperonin GroES
MPQPGTNPPQVKPQGAMADAMAQAIGNNPMAADQGSQGIDPAQAATQAPPTQDIDIPEEQAKIELDRLLCETNIASTLNDEDLEIIGQDAKKGYEQDLLSRVEWEKNYDEWLKLAMQVKENKSYPWANASNVKYPLLSTAAMQFAARAYPSLVPSNGQIVKIRVVGDDKSGKKAGRAYRLGQYLSWQIMEKMPDWEEEMDKLLITLPIVGTVFKKTYYSELYNTVCSHIVYAKDLVVNYWTKDLENAERVTQRYHLTQRQINEKIAKGLYLDVPLPEVTVPKQGSKSEISGTQAPPEADSATPFVICEQHGWYDINKDDVLEPITIVFEETTGKVLRITARWAEDGVIKNEKDKVVGFKGLNYYTKFGFIPNPDGGFYDIGFGVLLGPLNEAVNTLTNQLIDSGTLSNLQAGFIGKGLRIKLGDSGFKPGEWKPVNATGDDLRKSIFPLPAKEPSSVLFQLLGMLIQSSKELASVAEIFTGKMPGQNTPAYTTKETIEQGMKLFTAVYKRVFRSLTREFRKIYHWNKLYPEAGGGIEKITDNPASSEDFLLPEDDIVPAADPQAASAATKIEKAQALVQLIQLGVPKQEVLRRLLEAMEVPDPELLLPKQQEQKPSPEVQKIQMEMQQMQKEFELKMQLEQEKIKAEQQKNQAELRSEQQKNQMELQAKQQEINMKLQFEREKLQLEREKLGLEREKIRMDAHRLQTETQMFIATERMKMQALGDDYKDKDDNSDKE